MNWQQHKKQLLKNPKLQKELKGTRLEYEIARQLIILRKEKHLTQKQLAEELGTKQSVISRVETAQTTPSLTFLKRISQIFDMRLIVQFQDYG